MKYIHLFLFLFILLMISCDENEPVVIEEPAPIVVKDSSDVDGQWSLLDIAVFASDIDQYENGDILWTFDDKKLTIEINVEIHEFSNLKYDSAGTYPFDIEDNSLYIEDEIFSWYYFKDNYLVFDLGSAVDGPVYTFVKIE